MNIFVAKLSFNTDSEGLRAAFEQYGAVDAANVIYDRDSDRSKGFGFVEMADEGQAHTAIRLLDNSDLDGHTIVVKKAEPRESRTNNGGGFGGNRGGGGGNFDRPRRDWNNRY